MAKKRPRPTQTKGGMVRVVGYLDEDEYDAFVEFVAKDRGSQSDTIRRALREYIGRRSRVGNS